MRKKFQIFACACAASLLTLTALAQETPTPKAGGAEYPSQHRSRSRADRLRDVVKASDIIGMTVKNYQDEKLGKLNDLVVDVESGRIVQVILSTGGFLGMGDTLSAVPPGVLHRDAANKVIHLNASKAKLKAAPKYDTSKSDESTESNRVMEAYAYYGEEPYFVARREAYGISTMDVNRNMELPLHMDGTLNTDAPRTVEKARNTELARNVEENGKTISTRNPDETWTRERYANENKGTSPVSSLGYVQAASRLMGAPVKNLEDQKLGKVENFMVDLSAGRIVAVVISAGGFIGMGDELSAVPPTALRFNAQHDTLQLDASKEMLAGSPHFKASEWPDLSQPGYAGEVYRAYKIEPYFLPGATTEASTPADNTRQNVRDRDNRTLTPLDQGSSQADVNTTARIRKEILADKGMSVNARNVKIITKNGRITLRGPVGTAQEKGRIEEIANRIGHSENVNSQLEVTPGATTSSDN